MVRAVEVAPLLLQEAGGSTGVIPDLGSVFPRPRRDAEQPGCCSIAKDTNFTAAQIDDFFDEVLVDRDKSEAGVDAKQDAKAEGDIYPMCTKLRRRRRSARRQATGCKLRWSTSRTR
jgi:hypothetical protein